MMWLLFAVLLVFARHADCGALRCADGGICTAEGASRARASVELPSGEDCAPGSSWMNECNHCHCSPSGHGLCTLMECYGRDSGPQRQCAPNTSWKKQCNTCHCDSEGKRACTAGDCGNQSATSVELPSGEDCAPGSSWVDECNHCHCSSSGRGLCTLMECYGRDSGPQRQCAPNTSWKKQCNTCHCDSEGKRTCTARDCGDQSATSVELRSGEDCAPGSSWMNQCNHCLCSDTGYGECTLMGCDERDSGPERQCAPNTSWKKQCNTCHCDSDGKPACTTRDCSQQSARALVELPSGEDCAPGSSWMNECNHCLCSHAGYGQCTLMGCLGRGHGPQLHCAPNTSWKKQCNTCHCSDDGQPICTAMDCGEQTTKTSVELPSGEDCAPGSSWMNECNQCFCSHTGYAGCTRMECVGRGHGPHLHCAPNTSWKKQCNTCHCSDDGQPICTAMDCGEQTTRASVELPSGEDCAPGSSWMADCNHCSCSPTGYADCTRMECVGRESGSLKLCAPNTSWKKQCNTCHCSDDGQPRCTAMECTQHSGTKVAELDQWQNDEVPKSMGRSAVNTTKAVICVANRMFIKDCNTCWCNEDGTSFYCTRRVCTVPDDLEEAQKVMNAFEAGGWNYFNILVTQARLSRKIRAFQEGTKQCQPGQEFRLDCNKCLCDNEGQNFSCTRMDCNSLNYQREVREAIPSARSKRETEKEKVKCVPGSVFDRGCNVCRCSEEGHHAVCTMKICRKDKPSEVHVPGSRARPWVQM